ncbi:MAG: PH domain-containing protein [Planctomycetes bacterium]|nr:PH domain-containing protein [Planctomycetota bacterium]
MTDDSEPPAGGAPDPASGTAAPVTAPRAVVVLAKGHLHPAVLLLRLLDALRQAAFPVLLGAVFQPWFLVLAAVLFLLQLGYAVARYLTLEYTLTADELRVREGILERQERRIPLDRIQDLGFESTILRRALGLVVVMVETASGRGVEARLDALSRADADHLREVLLAARRDRTSAPASAADGEHAAAASPPPPEPEWIVHRSTSGELLLRGVTDLRLSAFVVTGFAALQLADQLGIATRMLGIAGDFQQWLGRLSPVVLVLLLASLLLSVIAFGVVTATIGNLVQFHGFTLALRGQVLQRRFGLLTTRQKTLPRARIQRVTVEQPWLRRLLGFAVVKADSAGGSRQQGEDTSGGWDVVVPLTRLAAADALLPALIPGIEQQAFGWQRGSRRLILRTALQGVVLAALAVPAFWAAWGPWALLALVLVPVWALLGVLAWQNLGFALGGPFLALRHGIVGRYLAYVPTAKVQAVVVRQSPFAQLLGLADLTVYVAGGSPTRLPDLTLGDAKRLALEIAEHAAVAAAADW